MRARLQKVLAQLLGDDGHHPELRRAAAAKAAELAGAELPVATKAPALPAALAGWVESVARTAWRTTDEDVAALRAAGYDEDAIFETTIAAATGAALARYQIAMRALKQS